MKWTRDNVFNEIRSGAWEIMREFRGARNNGWQIYAREEGYIITSWAPTLAKAKAKAAKLKAALDAVVEDDR